MERLKFSASASITDFPFCSLCRTRFSTKRSLENHYKSSNTHAINEGRIRIQSHPCPFCERSFTRKRDLARHLGKRQCRRAPALGLVLKMSGSKMPNQSKSTCRSLGEVDNSIVLHAQYKQLPFVQDDVAEHVIECDSTHLNDPPCNINAQCLAAWSHETSSFADDIEQTALQASVSIPIRGSKADNVVDVDNGKSELYYVEHDASERVVSALPFVGTPRTNSGARLDSVPCARSSLWETDGIGAVGDAASSSEQRHPSLAISQEVPVRDCHYAATDIRTYNQDSADMRRTSVRTVSDTLSRMSIASSPARLPDSPSTLHHDAHSTAHEKTKRASVVASVHSTASKDTLGSVGSLFLNRSIRSARLSVCSLQEQPQIPLPFTFIRAETASSQEMPGPLCTEVDAELRHSRIGHPSKPSSWKVSSIGTNLGRRVHEPSPPRNVSKHYGPECQYVFISQVLSGDARAVEQQLSAGCIQPDVPNHISQTPLFIAALHGHVEVVKVLLGTNAVDVSRQDVYGATALSEAAARGHCSVVKCILEARKAQDSCDSDQLYNALMYADLHGHEDVVTLLREWIPQSEF